MTKRNTVIKTTSVLLATLMLVATLVVLGTIAVSAAPATGSYDVNGDGTNDTAYKISTAADLLWFANEVNGGNNQINGVLMNDIDLSTVCSATLGNWTPIGTEAKNFKGSFDGRGFTVKNIYYNNTTDGDYVGLFGYVSNPAVIQNVTVTGTLAGVDCVAGIVGRTMGSTSGDPAIRNCVNYANVSADRYAAGILGFGSANIYNCTNHGDMSATGSYAGGIVAFGYDNIVQNCANFGTISGGSSYGLGHMNQASCQISNFVNFGSAGSDGVSDKAVTNCYSVSNTSVSGATKIDASDARIASGELAYMLGEGWGQEIGVDAAPVPGGMKVYYTMDPATLCTATTPTYMYANSENTKRTHDANMPAEDYDNGFCTICGEYQPATDGDGDSYYEIGNAGQLYWFAAQVNGGSSNLNAELVANITVNSNVLTASGDLNGNPEDFRAWTPIGISDANDFEGTFQGNGYVISGLYAKYYGVGFIKMTGSGAKIYNLGVMDSYFLNDNGSGHGYASGAIAGYLSGSSIVVENCFSNATIAGNSYISGGLIGAANSYPTIKNCYYFGKTVGSPFSHTDFSWNSKSGTNYYVSTTDDENDYTVDITMEDVTSGKLAYMLGGAFGQNLDNGETVQSYPVISDAKVYSGYTTCDEAQTSPIYTNNSAVSATKPAHHDFVYAASGNEIAKNCGECNKLMGTATVTAINGKYTGLPVGAVVNGTGDYASESFVITYTDAEGNSTTTAPTAIGSYTASFTTDGETASTSFIISKGIMSVSAVPTSTHEYGDTHTGKPISGKVVINGNESVEITGTWAWVGSTTTATFTPDAEFVDLFEALAAQDVTITVTEATPVITITSPSPSIMPGMSIMFGREVTNPHTDTPESLPIHYRYVYKIGESGTLQYSTASKLTIPSDVTVGEIIYVYVENIAEAGKYAVGKSNTVELRVGQIDYSEDIQNVTDDLDAAKAKLDQAILDLEAADQKNADDLAQAIIDLNSAISTAQAAAEAAAKAEDQTLKTALESKIDTAEAALDAAIQAVQDNLDQAIIDLGAADQKNADDLAQAITDLNSAISAAQAAAEATAKAEDQTLKTALESKIDTAEAALDEAIKQVQKNLDDAKAELNKAIADGDKTLSNEIDALTTALNDAKAALEQADADNKAELVSKIETADAALDEAIKQVQKNLDDAKAELNKAIADCDKALSDEIDALEKSLADAKAALEKSDADNKAELVSKIETADKALDEAIKQVQNNLDSAKAELEKAITDGDKANADALAQAISNLNAAIDAAETAATTADGSLKSELTTKISSADATLEAAIDALTGELDSVKSELEAKDAELQTFIIIVCVISSVTFCGCGTLAVFFIIDKKKRI